MKTLQALKFLFVGPMILILLFVMSGVSRVSVAGALELQARVGQRLIRGRVNDGSGDQTIMRDGGLNQPDQ